MSPPRQRVTFRPRVLLVFSSITSVLFTAACLWGWVALGELREDFTVLQIGTLLIFLAWCVGLMMAMALSVVVVDGSTLTVRNGLITRRYPLTDVRAVRYRDGDSWAGLELHTLDETGDHRRRQLMAIQRVDGARSRQAAARLRELVRERR